MSRRPRIDPAPCEGAKGGTPEAALCRRCIRTQVPCDPDTARFIVPMVRVDASALGKRVHCELFVGEK